MPDRIYNQTGVKRSPFGQRKIYIIRQVTSYGSIYMKFSMTWHKKGDLLTQVAA